MILPLLFPADPLLSLPNTIETIEDAIEERGVDVINYDQLSAHVGFNVTRARVHSYHHQGNEYSIALIEGEDTAYCAQSKIEGSVMATCVLKEGIPIFFYDSRKTGKIHVRSDGWIKDHRQAVDLYKKASLL